MGPGLIVARGSRRKRQTAPVPCERILPTPSAEIVGANVCGRGALRDFERESVQPVRQTLDGLRRSRSARCPMAFELADEIVGYRQQREPLNQRTDDRALEADSLGGEHVTLGNERLDLVHGKCARFLAQPMAQYPTTSLLVDRACPGRAR